jgi:hypothetical protein
MKITNTTRSDIGLQPGMIVPAGGSLDVDNDTLCGLKALPSVKDHLVEGRLVETGAAEVPVNDDLDALKARADALGVEYGPRIGADTLRDRIAEAEAVY